jgi:hypothetical protein
MNIATPPPRPRIILGLSVAVSATPYGFSPLESQHDLPLFGRLRWEGWAAALHANFADRLAVIGGVEALPRKSCPEDIRAMFADAGDTLAVPRGLACCHALEHDYRIDRARLGWSLSDGNTGGNVAVIAQMIRGLAATSNLVISTNHYHLPRVIMDLAAGGIAGVPCISAEAFGAAQKILKGDDRLAIRAGLIKELGGGPLATRIAAEIGGTADKILGAYQPLSA